MVWAKLALICPEKYFKPTSFELWSLGHLPICSCCFNIEEGAAVINNTGNTVLNFLGYYISWKCVLLINDKYWGQKKRVRRRLIFLLASEDFHVVVAFFFAYSEMRPPNRKQWKRTTYLGCDWPILMIPFLAGKKA